mmetsp:Transcript_34508/g.80670  ORF Transcript_34508/g.80670 Transcript_34508/m.80670 type:complete len:357 (+) Transcript_34508:128-1198(+)
MVHLLPCFANPPGGESSAGKEGPVDEEHRDTTGKTDDPKQRQGPSPGARAPKQTTARDELCHREGESKHRTVERDEVALDELVQQQLAVSPLCLVSVGKTSLEKGDGGRGEEQRVEEQRERCRDNVPRSARKGGRDDDGRQVRHGFKGGTQDTTLRPGRHGATCGNGEKVNCNRRQDQDNEHDPFAVSMTRTLDFFSQEVCEGMHGRGCGGDEEHVAETRANSRNLLTVLQPNNNCSDRNPDLAKNVQVVQDGNVVGLEKGKEELNGEAHVRNDGKIRGILGVVAFHVPCDPRCDPDDHDHDEDDVGEKLEEPMNAAPACSGGEKFQENDARKNASAIQNKVAVIPKVGKEQQRRE